MNEGQTGGFREYSRRSERATLRYRFLIELTVLSMVSSTSAETKTTPLRRRVSK